MLKNVNLMIESFIILALPLFISFVFLFVSTFIILDCKQLIALDGDLMNRPLRTRNEGE